MEMELWPSTAEDLPEMLVDKTRTSVVATSLEDVIATARARDPSPALVHVHVLAVAHALIREFERSSRKLSVLPDVALALESQELLSAALQDESLAKSTRTGTSSLVPLLEGWRPMLERTSGQSTRGTRREAMIGM